MNKETIKQFYVIGIQVRTTNENGQATKDIPALWNRFFTEGISANIPDKTDDALYCIYTDYEKDHTRPYTTVLGCKVSTLEVIPEGMVGITINDATYDKYVAKGNIMQGSVFNTWTTIWNSEIPRAFTADFEVYDERAKDMENAEVNIFIALKH
ncbi:GyrI-like domain-containing protein [Chitinophaga sp. B61]|uniref:GyrI-like domain-containing protein n=2 Tax=Chitinophaga rhizophila TaxID=2866212 RepID=A0ABS7GC24_9BACT|nr:GyrI-like domain-containing protein [Chitinophaga rhizophila]